MGKLFLIAGAALLFVACTTNSAVTPTDGGGSVGPPDSGAPPDAGYTPPPDAGMDAGSPDAGYVAPDAGVDGGTSFGGPGPWPIGNQTYGANEGIEEMPVVGVTTDETQNLWVATNSALYLMQPGQTRFTRFDANTGSTAVDGYIEHRLHLPGNVAAQCDDAAGLLKPCPEGTAWSPGISEIVGGGPNEVFVGYFGYHDPNEPNDNTEQDPYRHIGKLDRVRLQRDGTLEVVRLDMVSNNTVQFWHNRTVERLVYDHFIHPHELYVGTDHGVDKISPDLWHPPQGWFLGPTNQQEWMSDHLHPRACYHAPCVGDSNQRLGDWRALALDGNGDLYVGGRWAAGRITYLADNTDWYNNPRANGSQAFGAAWGDPTSGCDGERPIFCVPQEGDYVNLSAVSVAPDGRVWWSSGILYNDPGDVNYGIAAWKPGTNTAAMTYYDPMRDLGMGEENVRDLIALPDGRIVAAGPNSGLVFFDPKTGAHTAVHAGGGIPDDHVFRLELDTMVNPPALHVATWGGAAVMRVLP